MIKLSAEIADYIHEFIIREKLPASYAETAKRFYVPLAQRIHRLVGKMDQVPVVGINGGQGTGKSTCSALVAGLLENLGLRVLVISIDDLYFPKSVRCSLADEVHPLLLTRGVPGTHDMQLFQQIISVVRGETFEPDLVMPRFDKAIDDRSDEGIPLPAEGVDVVLFEGWCVGASAQVAEKLEVPCNSLEKEKDIDGRWRSYVNRQLAEVYAEAFALVDYLVMLKPPGFEVIYEWRGEQEEKLRQRMIEEGRSDAEPMSSQELAIFISHYERLTRHMLGEMPARADEVFLIGEDHEVYSNIQNPLTQRRYLISTDLDASLLDESYSWQLAMPALTKLAKFRAVLVLNSSKTIREMKDLARELMAVDGLGLPILVAENGGVLAVPNDSGGYDIDYLGPRREYILSVAHQLRAEHDYRFTGFYDMKVEGVMEYTGLGYEAAARAMDRQSTEPIVWHDSESRWLAFTVALEKEGIQTISGGRFNHLMGLTDKANGMSTALSCFQDRDRSALWTVVALGDSPNDLAMLNAADIAVAIDNPMHKKRLEPQAMRCIYPKKYGPAGWNEAILSILKNND